jgi:hypothetical protein
VWKFATNIGFDRHYFPSVHRNQLRQELLNWLIMTSNIDITTERRKRSHPQARKIKVLERMSASDVAPEDG